MIKLGKLLKEALDVSWNPFVENQNTWENYIKLCTERVASHINLDDTYNIIQLGGWGEEIELGEMTAREALDRYIEMCKKYFKGDIEHMFEYWEDFTSTDHSIEALVDDAIHVQDPELRTLDVNEELALELKPVKNNSNDLDEALDVSWNPYEETNNLWWYEEEGDGVDWDAIMDTIKAAANKVVGDTAPNRNSYFNVWYDVLKWHADTAWENLGDDDEDMEDGEVENACRGAIKDNIDPDEWEGVKHDIIYRLEDYTNIVANKKTLANFQKMGVLIHKMLSSKHKPSLSEALDVSWNPYEETNYKFKIGDVVPLEKYDGSVKILNRRSSLGDDMETSELDYGSIGNHWEDYLNYDENNPWYLFIHPEFKNEGPLWWPQSEFIGYSEVDVQDDNQLGDYNEALDVSWNPYEESNHATKTYTFVDFEDSKNFINPKEDTMVVFFQDEDSNDLRTDVKISTGIITGGEEWDGDGDEVDLSPKIIEQLNQNKSIRKNLDYIIKVLREGLDHKGVRTEALDISWNPYEDHDYTVMMGKLDKEGPNSSIIRHYAAKDEHSALTEFFIESLGQNPEYAEIAINGTKEVKLKNSIGYGTKYDNFFWIVAKGNYDENYMANISKEYRQKYNT